MAPIRQCNAYPFAREALQLAPKSCPNAYAPRSSTDVSRDPVIDVTARADQHPNRGAPGRRWASFVCALIVGVVALTFASNGASSGLSVASIRGVGLGAAGIFHWLDAAVSQSLQWLPLGTKVFRAAFATSLAAAAAAWLASGHLEALLAYGARRPIQGAIPAIRPRIIACVFTLAAFFASPLIAQCATPGGSVVGLLVVLLGTEFALRLPRVHTAPTSATALADAGGLGFALGAALTYDLPTFALTAATIAALCSVRVLPRASAVARGFALGLLPAAFGLLRLRHHTFSAFLATYDGAFGDVGAPAPKLLPFLQTTLGYPMLVAALGGAVWLGSRESRKAAGFLTATFLLAGCTHLLAEHYGVSAGSSAWLLLLIPLALAGFLFERVLSKIETLDIPAARASVGLLTVLGFALPLRTLDESAYAQGARKEQADLVFVDAAYASLPDGTIVLSNERGLARETMAQRVAGTMRDDIDLVPLFDLRQSFNRMGNAKGKNALIRDQLLLGKPTELSLSNFATEGPLAFVYDTQWDAALAHHTVENGLVLLYASEPRGSSDRRIAHEKFALAHTRLLRALSTDPTDPLRRVVVRLLKARCVAMAKTGERESLSLAIDELRPFAPNDPMLSELIRRVVLGRGQPDLSDLRVE